MGEAYQICVINEGIYTYDHVKKLSNQVDVWEMTTITRTIALSLQSLHQ